MFPLLPRVTHTPSHSTSPASPAARAAFKQECTRRDGEEASTEPEKSAASEVASLAHASHDAAGSEGVAGRGEGEGAWMAGESESGEEEGESGEEEGSEGMDGDEEKGGGGRSSPGARRGDWELLWRWEPDEGDLISRSHYRIGA